MPKPTRTMLSSATRMASSVLGPIRSGYSSSGIVGAAKAVKKPAAIGVGLFTAAGTISNRRRSGLDKTAGRPTGMYKY